MLVYLYNQTLAKHRDWGDLVVQEKPNLCIQTLSPLQKIVVSTL